MEQENASSKAKEYKSTGYMLIVLGVVGVVLNALNFTGTIHLPIANNMLSFVVMSILFIIFIALGIMSFQSAKRLAVVGTRQEAWIDQVKAFCKENLTAEKVDAYVLEAEDTDIYKTLMEEEKKIYEAMPDYDERMKNALIVKAEKARIAEEKRLAKIKELEEGGHDVPEELLHPQEEVQEEVVEASEEDLIYFERIEKMKAMIREGMETVEEEVLDQYVEELYDELFS